MKFYEILQMGNSSNDAKLEILNNILICNCSADSLLLTEISAAKVFPDF